ncbi:tetratricopeptide repeat protein [Oleidesulfovibrio sp.]|uniref:tetratricopeptide repeat protein n=1 Tax=Oleidesulfovibrio sp. TaxID=2909707 RepID=UPI003A8899C2
MALENTFPEILGVYSLQQDAVVGVGGTQSFKQQVTYWYVRRLQADLYEVQPLNAHHVPSGIRREHNEMDFLRKYVPEPSYYKTHTVPALNSLKNKLHEGEALLEQGDLDEAERMFIKALMIDGLNVTGNFGLGEVYSEKKDYIRLKRVIDTLLGIDEAFQKEQKARFNKFGISLRKNGHYDESLRFYNRALEVAEDDHLHFNVARVHFEKGDLDSCMLHLERALVLNSEFLEAQKFLKYCQGSK